MNEFDQFMKHDLKIKHYVRYTDDFVIIADNRLYLEELILPIRTFLVEHLALQLHPKKVEIRKFHHGIDFLGYLIFPHHRLVRTKTKQRMFKKMQKRMEEYRSGTISKHSFESTLQSYLGVFSHANTYRLREEILNNFFLMARQ